MGKLDEFEKQRLLAERLADEYGVDILRWIAARLSDPEQIAGVYCQVFQAVFEFGMRRAQRKARKLDPLAWLEGVAERILALPEDARLRMDVEDDLSAVLRGDPQEIDAVPPSLIVRNVQFIRATVARAQANLYHQGPIWLKTAITLTVIFGIAAVIWGGWAYMRGYAGTYEAQSALVQFHLNGGEQGGHE